jgi:hypothetical protein
MWRGCFDCKAVCLVVTAAVSAAIVGPMLCSPFFGVQLVAPGQRLARLAGSRNSAAQRGALKVQPFVIFIGPRKSQSPRYKSIAIGVVLRCFGIAYLEIKPPTPHGDGETNHFGFVALIGEFFTAAPAISLSGFFGV